MTMDELLLQAVEQRLLRPLDVQFALMVAQEATVFNPEPFTGQTAQQSNSMYSLELIFWSSDEESNLLTGTALGLVRKVRAANLAFPRVLYFLFLVGARELSHSGIGLLFVAHLCFARTRRAATTRPPTNCRRPRLCSCLRSNTAVAGRLNAT